MLTILVGAILIIGGVLYLFWEAVSRRRLSDPHRSYGADTQPTLEPRQQGLSFLGLVRNWPGLFMLVAGAVLLMLGAWG